MSAAADGMLANFKIHDDISKTNKTLKEVLSVFNTNLALPNFEEYGKNRKGNNSLLEYLNVAKIDECGPLIARAFYANGLSFI